MTCSKLLNLPEPCRLHWNEEGGNSLAVQWLGLRASTGVLRKCMDRAGHIKRLNKYQFFFLKKRTSRKREELSRVETTLSRWWDSAGTEAERVRRALRWHEKNLDSCSPDSNGVSSKEFSQRATWSDLPFQGSLPLTPREGGRKLSYEWNPRDW